MVEDLIRVCPVHYFLRHFYLPFVLGCVFVTGGLPCEGETEQPSLKKVDSSRTGKPKYRVLFNKDCSDFFHRGGNTPKAVQRMVDEIAEGGAEVLLVNPNAQRVNYPSKVWQSYWDGYTEGDRSFFGGISDEVVKTTRNLMVRSMAELAEQGDYLKIALDRCRHQGIAPGVSLRMNDMHDAPWPDSHQHSRFYRENPLLHLNSHESFQHELGRSWGSKGLDYEHQEVREHYLSLIRELAESYDFDVLELDFLRFPYYFDREWSHQDQHCEIMTGFIRQVRQILNSTGRHIDLIPRVASSPGSARQLGFDVQAWARQGIVDGITTGNFSTTSWDLMIEEFRVLVGPKVAIYASMEVTADQRDGIEHRYIPNNHEMLRGFAAGYYTAGADGVNTFNFFLARNHEPVTAEEFYGGQREMRSLEEARGKPRIHVLSASRADLVECDMPEQVPVVVRTKTARRFEMLLATEAEGQKTEAHLYFNGDTTPENLWLRIGLYSVGHALEIRKGSEGETRTSNIAVFQVPLGVIKDGRNELVVTTDKVDITVLGIDVHVRGRGEGQRR